MALPGTASAVADCSFVTGGTSAGGVTVYTTGGITTDSIAGVCVDAAGLGGYTEVGAGDPDGAGSGAEPGFYAVVDGHDQNPGPSAAYVGLSTYETAPGDPDRCEGNLSDPSSGGIADQSDEGSGTNSGGCFSVRSGPGKPSPELVSYPGVPIACGNERGPDWSSADRDGCTIP